MCVVAFSSLFTENMRQFRLSTNLLLFYGKGLRSYEYRFIYQHQDIFLYHIKVVIIRQLQATNGS